MLYVCVCRSPEERIERLDFKMSAGPTPSRSDGGKRGPPRRKQEALRRLFVYVFMYSRVLYALRFYSSAVITSGTKIISIITVYILYTERVYKLSARAVTAVSVRADASKSWSSSYKTQNRVRGVYLFRYY